MIDWSEGWYNLGSKLRHTVLIHKLRLHSLHGMGVLWILLSLLYLFHLLLFKLIVIIWAQSSCLLNLHLCHTLLANCSLMNYSLSLTQNCLDVSFSQESWENRQFASLQLPPAKKNLHWYLERSCEYPHNWLEHEPPR